MITIGIDPSINSTGICVNIDNKTYIYYIIAAHATKKMKQFTHDRIYIIDYNKRSTDTKMQYHEKEKIKSENIYDICQSIDNIICRYNPDMICMEGVSYGSTGSAALVDLSGLQYAIRMTIMRAGIDMKIISPTSLKKFAVGDGGAIKDTMITAWKNIDVEMKDITNIKIDDVADAYFLSNCTD